MQVFHWLHGSSNVADIPEDHEKHVQDGVSVSDMSEGCPLHSISGQSKSPATTEGQPGLHSGNAMAIHMPRGAVLQTLANSLPVTSSMTTNSSWECSACC